MTDSYEFAIGDRVETLVWVSGQSFLDSGTLVKKNQDGSWAVKLDHKFPGVDKEVWRRYFSRRNALDLIAEQL
jgi:hypothetical protein